MHVTAGPGLATFWGAYELLLYILPKRNALPRLRVYNLRDNNLSIEMLVGELRQRLPQFMQDTQPTLELATAACLFSVLASRDEP